MILVNKEVLYRFEVENKKYEMIIRTLLRAYSGIFDEFVNINEHEIGKFTEMTYEQVVNALRELQHFQLLQYEPQKDAPQVIFLKPRADSETMYFNYTHLEKRKEANESRAAAIKSFILNNEKCRSQQLLEYFGEEDAARCGICDVCLKRNQLALSDIEFDQITGQVKKTFVEAGVYNFRGDKTF
jgi:ATP-dependent DNA helicase RecQ